MFEVAEVGHRVSKERWERELESLRVELINAQYDVGQADFPVLVLVDGDDRPGCQQLLDGLNAWLDARYLRSEAFAAPSGEELERPTFWRYWRALPRRGAIALFYAAWPTRAIADRVLGGLDAAAFEARLDTVRRLERSLVADGTLLVKLWLHLPHKELRKRLKRAKKDPDAFPYLGPEERRFYEVYDEGMAVAEHFLRRTSTGEAPWHLIESSDEHYRNLTALRLLRDALAERLAAQRPSSGAPPEPAPRVDPEARTVLAAVDLDASLSRADYRKRLRSEQARLARLARRAREQGRSAVLALEGWDAAGKGGILRRITAALDARYYRVYPIGKPTEEELAHHYLWRFWTRLPRAGHMAFFDRSWYGRVLVERVERLAEPAAWRRAYEEINDFEEQIVQSGAVIAKFWIEIGSEEQERRFRARADTPYKKHKLTREDWRNRARWTDYELAVNEMIARTSTEYAPWHLVAGNDKRWARVEVLNTLCDALEKNLED